MPITVERPVAQLISCTATSTDHAKFAVPNDRFASVNAAIFAWSEKSITGNQGFVDR